MNARLLLGDPDRAFRSDAAGCFRSAGFEVVEEPDQEAVLDRLRLQTFECVVVDRDLPPFEGSDLCKLIRAQHDTPLVYLGRTNPFEVVSVLECGVDKHVAKPVEPDVLLARVLSLLRTVQRLSRSRSLLRIGDVVVDFDSASIEKDGQQIALTSIEWALLRVLASRPNVVFTREFLGQEVWGITNLHDDGMLTCTVKRLRRKFGSARDSIATVRGIGYKLVGW